MRFLSAVLACTMFVAFPTATTPAPPDDTPTLAETIEMLDRLADGELPPEKDYSGTPPWVLSPIDEEDQHVDEHHALPHIPWHRARFVAAEPDDPSDGRTRDLIRPPQA